MFIPKTTLHLPVEIVACPILREPDGLAMSSRNTRLTPQERQIAALIPKMMQQAVRIVKEQGIAEAKEFIGIEVAKEPMMKLDYFEVCDADTLLSLHTFSKDKPAVCLIALFVGNIRLIDNWMIN
ncbi:MAG: pantoate--beta-alanine ligase [Bacteroidetes bacterium]|nr:pantoate--beta-alanine ligase [Bacteroidota bacterium]